MPLCWFSLVKILKPEQLDQKAFDSLREAAAEAGRPTNYEVRALIMILALPVLWILGTWIPVLNVTTVAIIGLAIMFIPGINLLTWEEFSASVPWTIILMVGAVLSLGNMFSATGARRVRDEPVHEQRRGFAQFHAVPAHHRGVHLPAAHHRPGGRGHHQPVLAHPHRHLHDARRLAGHPHDAARLHRGPATSCCR